MQKWITNCVAAVLYSEKRNNYTDYLIKETKKLLAHKDRKLRVIQASVLEFLGAAISFSFGSITQSLWVMFLQPFVKAGINETIGEELKGGISKYFQKYDKNKFAFIINSYKPSFYRE